MIKHTLVVSDSVFTLVWACNAAPEQQVADSSLYMDAEDSGT